MREKSVKLPYLIKAEGSLGLLALGDVGLIAWREARVKADAKIESKSQQETKG